MKFKITRTSALGKKPCEEAILEKIQYGNYVSYNYYIEIEFKDIEQLSKKYGELIIEVIKDGDLDGHIEIYDTAREG